MKKMNFCLKERTFGDWQKNQSITFDLKKHYKKLTPLYADDKI